MGLCSKLAVAAAPSLIGGVTSALGARGQSSQSDVLNRSQELNFQTYKDSLLHGPGYEMAGLRSAGINPLLRYGQHGSPTPVSTSAVSAGTPINPLQGLADAITGAGTSAADVVSRVAQSEKLIEETKKTTQEIDKVIAEINNIESATDLNHEQRRNMVATRRQILADIMLTYAKANLTNAQYDQVQANIDLLTSQTAINQWNELAAKKIGQSADILFALFLDTVLLGKDAAEGITEGRNWLLDLF